LLGDVQVVIAGGIAASRNSTNPPGGVLVTMGIVMGIVFLGIFLVAFSFLVFISGKSLDQKDSLTIAYGKSAKGLGWPFFPGGGRGR
jgi:hypothetical protein